MLSMKTNSAINTQATNIWVAGSVRSTRELNPGSLHSGAGQRPHCFVRCRVVPAIEGDDWPELHRLGSAFPYPRYFVRGLALGVGRAALTVKGNELASLPDFRATLSAPQSSLIWRPTNAHVPRNAGRRRPLLTRVDAVEVDCALSAMREKASEEAKPRRQASDATDSPPRVQRDEHVNKKRPGEVRANRPDTGPAQGRDTRGEFMRRHRVCASLRRAAFSALRRLHSGQWLACRV